MRISCFNSRKRRGVTLAESGLVYSMAMLMIVGTMIAGLGVYRYEQVARLANYGARWASVHGRTWQQESGQPAPTSTGVYNAILPNAVGLNASDLSCVLTTSSNTVSVTVNYTWVPEGYWNSITLSNTAVMPVSY